MTADAKAALRANVKTRVAALTATQRRAADARIAAAVLGLLPRGNARPWRIAAYASLGSEVQTDAFLRELCLRYGGVALPVYDAQGNPALAWCEHPDELVAGPHHVRVPPAPLRFVNRADLHVIVVPGLAFDRGGGRLGRGAGFYDRLLSGIGVDRIGMAYDCQVVERVPAEAHDAAVDYVVTEAHVYAARGWRIDSK